MGRRNSILIFTFAAVVLLAVVFYFRESDDALLQVDYDSIVSHNLSGRYEISEASRNKIGGLIGLAAGDSCALEIRGLEFTSEKFPVFDLSKGGHVLSAFSGSVKLRNDHGKAVLVLVFPSAIPSVKNGLSLDLYRNRAGTLFLCFGIDDPDDIFQATFVRR